MLPGAMGGFFSTRRATSRCDWKYRRDDGTMLPVFYATLLGFFAMRGRCDSPRDEGLFRDDAQGYFSILGKRFRDRVIRFGNFWKYGRVVFRRMRLLGVLAGL